MIFKGVGQVKWKDRVIANFALSGDGTFETNDVGVIQRLQMLDFKEFVAETPAGVTIALQEPLETEKPKKAKKGKQ